MPSLNFQTTTLMTSLGTDTLVFTFQGSEQIKGRKYDLLLLTSNQVTPMFFSSA